MVNIADFRVFWGYSDSEELLQHTPEGVLINASHPEYGEAFRTMSVSQRLAVEAIVRDLSFVMV